jgi:DNA-binding CsgD family transcriptional regulator
MYLLLVTTHRDRRRCRERLQRLSDSTLDCDSLRFEAIGELQRVIGFDRWCWPLADPETLLPSSGLAEHDYVPGVPRALELEYTTDALAAKHVLARRANGAARLSAETSGDLARSSRWDQVMRPVGIGDVAVVACRDELGCWGWIEAYRDRGDPGFDDADVALLAGVGVIIGAALRRATYAGASSAVAAGPPGIVILDHNWKPVSWTVAARAWIDALPGARFLAQLGMLPSVVYPAAAVAQSEASPAGAHAILRTVDARWVVVEAARLEGRDDRQTAITLRSASATEIFELLCRGYAFTRRERQVVAALAAGLDTRALAQRLFISPHTVQDHLKAVFDKVGVHSRRELLATFRGSESAKA